MWNQPDILKCYAGGSVKLSWSAAGSEGGAQTPLAMASSVNKAMQCWETIMDWIGLRNPIAIPIASFVILLLVHTVSVIWTGKSTRHFAGDTSRVRCSLNFILSLQEILRVVSTLHSVKTRSRSWSDRIRRSPALTFRNSPFELWRRFPRQNTEIEVPVWDRRMRL